MRVEELKNRHDWHMPTVCPRCGSELTISSSGYLECPNEDCIAKTEHRFARFFSLLGVKAAGPAFTANAASYCTKNGGSLKLLTNHIYRNDKKLFNEWAGGINGEKILKQTREYIGQDSTKTITPAQLCAMIDWPGLSVKQFEKIARFSLSDALNGVPYSELKVTDGIGDATAEEMMKFWKAKSNELKDLSQDFEFAASGSEESEQLQTICFTGACPGHSRKELAEMCKGKYTVVGSVTKDTSFLACEDPSSGSAKLQKAAKCGTKIISYEELLRSLKE